MTRRRIFWVAAVVVAASALAVGIWLGHQHQLAKDRQQAEAVPQSKLSKEEKANFFNNPSFAGDYDMDITLPSSLLKHASEDARLVVAKQIDGAVKQTVWASFKLSKHIMLSWNRQYGLYQTTADPEWFEVVRPQRRAAADLGRAYQIGSQIRRLPKNSPLTPAGTNAIVAHNAATATLCSGLTQALQVDGRWRRGQKAPPLGLTRLKPGHSATFTPTEKIYLYFTGTQNISIKEQKTGALIADPKTTAPYSYTFNPGQPRSLKLNYNTDKGLFNTEFEVRPQ